MENPVYDSEELFSDTRYPLQTSDSDPDDDDDAPRYTSWHDVDMADLFRPKRHGQDSVTPRQSITQRSESAPQVSHKKKNKKNSSPTTPSVDGTMHNRRHLSFSVDHAQRKENTPYSHKTSRGEKKGDSDSAVASALLEMSNTLGRLIKRIESTEKEVKALKSCPSSSSGETSSTAKTKYSIPLVVRSETRKLYQTLLEDDENFDGFNIQPPSTFKDPCNQAVVLKLIQEVHSLNPSFQSHDIRGAAYTYYKTLRQNASLNRRGVSDVRKKQRRRRERNIRKLQERQSIFAKRSYQPNDKAKWQKILKQKIMSSEESEEDKIIIRPLSWRSSKVDQFFHALDEQLYEEKSAQAKRQTKERVIGDASNREKPPDIAGIPSWAFKD